MADNSKDRVLITADLQEIVNREEPVLFLGEWCTNRLKPDLPAGIDYLVSDYHWDDVNKLIKDEKYCYRLYDLIMPEISRELNRLHGLDWDLRSWKLIIGPWVRRFITILFDRFECLEFTLSKYQISKAVCCLNIPASLQAKDREDFSENTKSASWNFKFYSRLIRDYFQFIEIETVSVNDKIPVTSRNQTFNKPNSLRYLGKEFIKKIIYSRTFKKIFLSFTRKNKYYVYLSYLPSKLSEIWLYIKLGSFPVLNFPEEIHVHQQFNKNLRSKLSFNFDHNEKYQKIISDLLPEMMPIIYIEQFPEILEQAEKFKFPVDPKLIFTTIGIYTDEIFKVWLSGQLRKGNKLAVGQHGGHYATFKVTAEFLPHELEISDYYLSWGWGKEEGKIRSIPCLKNIGRKYREWNGNGEILIINRFLRKYCTQLSTGSLPGKVNGAYLELIEELVRELQGKNIQEFSLRLHPGESGEEERDIPIREHLTDTFPGIRIASNSVSLEELFYKNKLNIFTYDGTSFLECIGLGYPCMMISNPEFDPFSELAQPYYDELEAVGIYHRTSASAADFISQVKNDVFQWWNDEEVKVARENYSYSFARSSNNGINAISHELKALMNAV